MPPALSRLLRSFKARTRQFLKGLAAPWGFWLGLALWAGATALAFLLGAFVPYSNTDAITYAGMLSQLIGIGTVAYGLERLRRSFGRPSLGKALWRWLCSIFGPTRSATPAIGAGVLQASGATLSASGRVGPPPGATVEERLRALENDLQHLRCESERRDKELRQQLNDLSGKVDKESGERQRGFHQLHQTLEETAIGGLHLEAAGLTTLILGTIMVSVPGEIVGLLGG